MRGYFGIGVYNLKNGCNLGTLWRSAHLLGAAFIFTIGWRYELQASDTTAAWRSVPLFQYPTWGDFLTTLPRECMLVGVEQGGRPLKDFTHPERCIYVLGAEDHGIPPDKLAQCRAVVTVESVLTYPYNVAVAGSIVMYDRIVK